MGSTQYNYISCPAMRWFHDTILSYVYGSILNFICGFLRQTLYEQIDYTSVHKKSKSLVHFQSKKGQVTQELFYAWAYGKNSSRILGCCTLHACWFFKHFWMCIYITAYRIETRVYSVDMHAGLHTSASGLGPKVTAVCSISGSSKNCSIERYVCFRSAN